MRYLVSGTEMSLYDQQTSGHFRIPSVVLMEQAAHVFVDRLMQEITGECSAAFANVRVLVVCGTGNNGGDGIAIARLLNQRGVYTEIYASVEGHRTSELFDLQYQIYQAYNYPICERLSCRQGKTDVSCQQGNLDASCQKENPDVSCQQGNPDASCRQGKTVVSCRQGKTDVSCQQGDSDVRFSQDGESDKYVIDAIFGTGLSRPVTGTWADIIESMNAMSGHKIAVDIASGVSADSGAILGTAFRADETITFSFGKLGQYLWPGASCSGKVTVVPIGITEESFLGTVPRVRAYEDADLCRLPSRKPNSHKGSYGKLLVIAGSAQMAGAAIFAAKAAYRMGTGLVKVMTPEANRVIIQTQVPEAILSTYPENSQEPEAVLSTYSENSQEPEIVLSTYPDSAQVSETFGEVIVSSGYPSHKDGRNESVTKEQSAVMIDEWKRNLHQQLRKELSWADALVIGPGIGTGEAATELLRPVLEESEIPMVLDADALNIISREGWQNLLQLKQGDITTAHQEPPQENEKSSCRIIITPHMGEMSRLTGKTTGEIKEHICEEALQFATDHQVVCVLKDARTVTAVPDGAMYLNLSGNNGMATAGSGDVLSGILGGLLAQGLDPAEAAPLGVYFHGRAGDAARDRIGARHMMASDIINAMNEIR